MKEAEELPQKVMDADILNEGGLLVFEHSDKKDYSGLPGFREVRKYGKVNFSIFEKV
jgi:hypothetical protein